VAGALLAFALSFDEIVVTNFTAGSTATVPKFIYNNLRLPRNRPVVNVVALAVILVMFVPIYAAQRLAAAPTRARRPRGPRLHRSRHHCR
jgi:putative spermidine/putrescine transport system permease protein